MSFTNSNGDNIKKEYQRKNAIPVLYTRGTHYEIGFDVVRLNCFG